MLLQSLSLPLKYFLTDNNICCANTEKIWLDISRVHPNIFHYRCLFLMFSLVYFDFKMENEGTYFIINHTTPHIPVFKNELNAYVDAIKYSKNSKAMRTVLLYATFVTLQDRYWSISD